VRVSAHPSLPSYEDDFYAWALANAALLRAQRFDEIDFENIAEELEGMARSERRELVSRLAVLLAHLLKWRYQPLRRGKSWRATIKEQRRILDRLLADNPILRNKLPEYVADAYGDAVQIAVRETNLDEESFPQQCPWALTQVLDPNYWPD
jgi:hypothetical protein